MSKAFVVTASLDNSYTTTACRSTALEALGGSSILGDMLRDMYYSEVTGPPSSRSSRNTWFVGVLSYVVFGLCQPCVFVPMQAPVLIEERSVRHGEISTK